MMRHLAIPALLLAALCAIACIPLAVPEASAGSWPMLHIMTRNGVPNPHVRSDEWHPWNDCWGCHTERRISPAQLGHPREPCAACHLPATPEERAWAAACNAPVCPVIINYWQKDGTDLAFFFGNKR